MSVSDSIDKDKLIERIKALFALGDKNRNDNENEANVATTKAQQLLQKHNLSMSEVIGDSKKIKDGVIDGVARESKKSSIPKWESRLLSIVANATETHPYIEMTYLKVEGERGSKARCYKMRFIGTEWDVAIAKELYCFLHSTLTKLANQKYARDFTAQTSYLKGACDQLSFRIAEQNRRFKRENEKNQGYALMVVNKKDAIKEFINDMEFVQREYKEGAKASDLDAYYAGVNDANKMDIGNENRLT